MASFIDYALQRILDMKLKRKSMNICIVVLICTVFASGLIACDTQQQSSWIKVDHPELEDENYISEVKERYHTFIFDAVSVYFDFIENLGDNSIIKGYKVIQQSEGEKIFQAKSLENLRFLEVKLVLEELPDSDGLEVWVASEYRYLEAEDKVMYLAEIWAESLKTREGKPRYEIMSEELKEEFIKQQKQRSGDDNWNYNIGTSSPWVEGYEIAVEENTASIRYFLADSIPQYYDHTETLTTGEEDGKLVVISVEESLDEWQRYYYFAPTAEQAMEVYKQALLERDYMQLLALTYQENFVAEGQKIWDTIKISEVKVIKEDVREKKAYYELELHIEDGGDSEFESGVYSKWLYLIKGEDGWYVEKLTADGEPSEEWWDN